MSDFDLDPSKNSSLKEYMQEKVLTTVLSYRVTTPILDRPRRDFYLPLQRDQITAQTAETWLHWSKVRKQSRMYMEQYK